MDGDRKVLSKKIIFVIGVSGSGKSTIAQLLSKELSIPFFEGDDFHPPYNVEKMSNNIPLSDEDRWSWLETLNQLARANTENGCVIACSALKSKYRTQLAQSIVSKVLWIYLHGTAEQIKNRLVNRKNHFMGSDLLNSQFEILEEPIDAIKVDITDNPLTIIESIMSLFCRL